jgi:predicted transcriptional regulator
MGDNAKLSECEEMIMSILLNSNEDLTLTEIMEKAKVRFQKEWKMQTVATFMTRMEQKGYISSYRVGRYSHYRPEIKLYEFREQKFHEMQELLLFSNTVAMANFLRDM